MLINFNQCWLENVLSPSVISSSLYYLSLSTNISGNLLMCDCFLQIIFLVTFHILTLLFLCLLIKSEKYCCLHFIYILMLTYSYTFCTLVHLEGFYFL